MLYDLAIVGGGPAGVGAGVYAARKLLKTIFITKEWGGQSNVSLDVQNWIGTPSVTGADLAKMLEEHLKRYAGEAITIKESACVTSIKKEGDGFSITLDDKTSFNARSVLIASGANRRTLNVPGAAEFDQKGLTYCASCDGPLFSDMDVAVIGGGNAGFETAAQLLAYAKSVILLHHHPEFNADPVTVSKVLTHPKMKALRDADVLEIKGDKFVTGLRYKDTKSGEEHGLAVNGVFVEIGLIPSTSYAEGLLDMDEYKRIKVDHKTQRTSVPGIWAAGDCTDSLYHQNNIAAGDAVKALEDIYNFLKAR